MAEGRARQVVWIKGTDECLNLLGWLGPLELRSGWLLRQSMPEEFACETCGERFSRRTLGARVALVVRWVGIGVVGVLVALGVALAVMDGARGD